jgi:hypothetical protein
MTTSSVEKKTMEVVVREEIEDVQPTQNNSGIKFFQKVPPFLKGQPGQPICEQQWAFCCKAPLSSRMFAICLFRAS